ncbi:sporulation-specific diadenylate cyclase CdaS [Paenibacillus thermotolerans]|uniref:sporulation-specific diadenylate cyclase CdaS n=1 Tax=Paenibacillus thermotolerans TaxID=3027807 RepID=UPI002368B6D7|nr:MULTISPECIES: sporulation-specific diadenylate cyclase CdaS [unclassified Paenibacillus]
METNDCDFSPLKEELKEKLKSLGEEVDHIANVLDREETCLLNDFEQLKRKCGEVESLASTFYLKCYLSSFTEKYAEIAASVRNLSERRHGALLAVQRSEPLDPFVTPGIPVNASLTHSLLESIFVPGSPLHDGAVLIQQNIITSATNVLPLSQRVTGQKKLGTRHRAALGLTERCDALVIVVSEETGQASFSIHGNMYPFTVH